MTMHRTSNSGETSISRIAAVQKSNARFALDSHHWLGTTIPVSVEKNFASLLLNRSLERDLNIQLDRSAFVFSDCDLLKGWNFFDTPRPLRFCNDWHYFCLSDEICTSSEER